MGQEYDFSGFATRSNIPCADGRTILPDAFKDCDGKTVPLVWQHLHDSVDNILGHALLTAKDGDIYCDCVFNDTESGQKAKKIVQHGDIVALSIFANKLKQHGKEVVHGVIREVSLVLAGANPGAFIDNVSLAHGDGQFDTLMDEAVIQFVLSDADIDTIRHGEEAKSSLELFDEAVEGLDEAHKDAVYAVIGSLVNSLEHSEEDTEPVEEPAEEEGDEEGEEGEEELEHAEPKTVGDLIATFTDEENAVAKAVVHAALGKGKLSKQQAEAFLALSKDKQDAVKMITAAALEEGDGEVKHSDNLEEGDQTMKFNVFDAETGEETALSHDVMTAIFDDAKRTGSLKDAVLAHGITNIEVLFPEVQAVNKAPYPIMRRMEWVSVVISGTRKTPFSRIKSTVANMTNEEARARGFIKGNQKVEEQISALRRITTPTTVYKLQKLDRDDIVDITDFDVVAWMKDEMRTMLDEEIARAILIGDGRSNASPDKINPLNIRPIWGDEAMYVINSTLVVTGMTIEQKAKAFVDQVVRSKKDYKGSGTPTMFISPELLVELRLLRDADGYRRYKTDQELADDLRVSKIVEVELFNGLKRTVDGVERELGAIIVNMSDYTVGATKGGEVTLFDDFDLNYNKYEYLIETRMCGALTMPYSAIVMEFVGQAVDTYKLVSMVGVTGTDGLYYFDGTEYTGAAGAPDMGKRYYEKVTGATGTAGDETGTTGTTGD